MSYRWILAVFCISMGIRAIEPCNQLKYDVSVSGTIARLHRAVLSQKDQESPENSVFLKDIRTLLNKQLSNICQADTVQRAILERQVSSLDRLIYKIPRRYDRYRQYITSLRSAIEEKILKLKDQEENQDNT